MSIGTNDSPAFIISPQAQVLHTVTGAPRMTAAGSELLRELEVHDETGERRTLQIPVERPLTISIDGQELVTLMTLGAKPELLVLGYLRNQRIVQSVTQIQSLSVDWASNSAAVVLRGAAQADLLVPQRSLGTACSLGTVFGEWMRQVDAASPLVATRLSHAVLLRILDITRGNDAIHRAAGSVHGCALFRGADLWVSIEDVSRHNALDTVTGWMILHGVVGDDKMLYTTGRLTGEMVMKAAHNGVSIMVSRNGVTSMGCDMANKLGMALFGRAANARYVCYTGEDRFDR